MPYKVMIAGKKRWRGQVYLPDKKSKQKLCDTRAEAAKWEEEMRGVIAEEQKTPLPVSQDETSSDLLEWATAYMADAIRYTPKMVSEKRNVFHRLFEVIKPTTPWSSLTKAQALAYLQKQFKSRSGYAANKDRKNLVAAWTWAQDFIDGFPQTNPWKVVKRFPEQRSPRYVPPEKDFWAVVDAAQGQDKVMLLTLLYTAARKGEIFRLTWEDVDFSSGNIQLGTRKRQDGTMEYEWLPMDEELYHILLEHRQTAKNEWVFTQTVGRHNGKPYVENRDFPQALCREAGMREFGCHAIRHLSASVLASAGMPTKMIQGMLRHKHLTTTEKYVENLDSARPFLKVLRRKRVENVHSNVHKQKAPRVAPPEAFVSGLNHSS